MQIQRIIVGCGAAAALIGVLAGAFGAHLLRARVAPANLAIFVTASNYQLMHSLALLVVGALLGHGIGTRWLTRAAICFGAGIVLFSGSLYMRVLLDQRLFGALAPIGGGLLMFGWLLLLVAALHHGD